jgi:aldose 1-epimerase
MLPKLILLWVLVAVGISQSGCTRPCEIREQAWGNLPSGEAVSLFTLTNGHGMQADITNYGGIVVRLLTPDRNGKYDDVVLGYNSLHEYVERNPLFGAIVGLYANRIETGLIELDGEKVQLYVRERPGQVPVHTHGGSKGLDEVLWQATSGVSSDYAFLELKYLHADGTDGYPGNVQVTVTYRLTNDNALGIQYRATTDKTTIINLTNHSYFNLGGEGNGTILNHELEMRSDELTEVKPGLIPTGKFVSVSGTPFDFNEPNMIGARIDDSNEQLQLGRGYDHNYVLRKSGSGAELFATVFEPESGRVMEAYTDQPGVQFYTANGLNGIVGKRGSGYVPRSGFCLETQHYPDSPNHPHFPSTVLRPGERYESETIFKFSTR